MRRMSEDRACHGPALNHIRLVEIYRYDWLVRLVVILCMLWCAEEIRGGEMI